MLFCRQMAFPFAKSSISFLATKIDRGMLDRMFAFVRTYKPTKIAHIREAERHAKGINRSAQKRRRPDADARALAMYVMPNGRMSAPRVVHPDGHPRARKVQPELELEAAFKRHLKLHNASLRKDAAVGFHMIVGVSPKHFDNPADAHDPNSKPVHDLLLAACEWAEKDLGGVWHARYDVDEKGCGVVDVICSPLRTDLRTGRKWVSTFQAQAKLAKRWGQAYGYRAMQDAWAAFASKRLGRQFERGTPARESGRKHVLAEIYGEAMDEGKALEQKNERLAQENESMYRLRQERKQLEADRADLEREQAQWLDTQAARSVIEADYKRRLAGLRTFIRQRPWAWDAWPPEADTVLGG